MKEYVNRLVEIAKAFRILSNGADVDYSDAYVQVRTNRDGTTFVDIDYLISIVFWETFDKKTSFEIKDVSRIGEIISIIGKCENILGDD